MLALLLAAPASASGLSTAESSLLAEVNRTRAAHGLAPLRVDWNLQRAARSHSGDMLRRGYFGHGPWAQRIRSFGVKGPRVGENIAWGAGTTSRPRAIVGMWLNSPPHRANLLRPGFRRIGLAAPRGTFAGRRGTAVVTANFAGS
ncbi:MAG TPA: CAP domain-containing protein [Gaiellaceae bacterium]|jgi:uncharacterized protein YkwD|nr:CAP domain-containing protein [Gaiellaceae bacterium]